MFHCQPDNAVQNWKEYGEFTELEQEFQINQEKLIDLEAENINSTTTNVVDKDREKEQMRKAAELRMKLSGSLLYGFNQRFLTNIRRRESWKGSTVIWSFSQPNG